MSRFENIVMKDMSLRVMMRLNLQVIKKYLEGMIHNHHDKYETGEGVLFQLYVFFAVVGLQDPVQQHQRGRVQK